MQGKFFKNFLKIVGWTQLIDGSVTKLLRHGVSNSVGSVHMGLNPIVGITNHKPTASAAGPLKVVNENSEVTIRAQAIVLQAHISCTAAIHPACINK